MKERLTNNLGLKVLAILLAFFVWLIVSNVSNPLELKTQEVKVEILNEQVLKNSNLTYEVIGKSTVTVSYEVHTLDAHKISNQDFRAYADLSELYDVTGSIPIKIEVVNNKPLINNPSARPGVLQIETEAIQTKGFDLQTHIIGNAEEGYAQGTITLSPNHVDVTGAISAIGKINSVGVEIDLNGRNADFTSALTPVYYDANGNELEMGDEISLNISDVVCKVQILKVKNLNLDFQVSGKVASGYRFTGVESDVKAVSVEGMKSALASLSTLTVPGDLLKLDGATRDISVQVDISSLLPEDVILAGGEEIVASIVLKVEPLETRGLKVATEDIIFTGTEAGKTYAFSTKTLQVDIRGLTEDLDALDLEKLNLEVDVSHMEDGSNKGTLTMDLGEVFELVSAEAFEVLVESEVSDTAVDTKGTEGTTAEETTKETIKETTSSS